MKRSASARTMLMLPKICDLRLPAAGPAIRRSIDSLSDALHLDLDGAWTDNRIVDRSLDLRRWGPRLRFSAPPRLIEEFFAEVHSELSRFLLYGSGDFHHLTALWLRKMTAPFVLVSFDNHPDWDIRPPRWGCGGWLNRALELPLLEKAAVWGCGNFECWWPYQIFGNRKAERSGRLEVHPWVDDRTAAEQARRGAILRSNWRDRFQEFVHGIKGGEVYVTIDMDCLLPNEAVTNWENGRFAGDDVAWALQFLRQHCRIVGGDVCGAFSDPHYARWKQRFAGNFDHPKMVRPPANEARAINLTSLAKIWRHLAGQETGTKGG